MSDLRGEELSQGPEPRRAAPARRRRWLAGLAVASVLLSAAGVGAARLIRSPAQVAAETAPPAADVLTAPVEHRVLKDTIVLRGTVRADQTVEVAPRSAGGDGTPVITRVPVEAGQRVKAGQVLLEVSGRPVFVLPGDVPAYRDLRPGAEGRDVAQVQSALRGLGHDTGADAEGVFGAGTKAALAALYAAAGYEPRPAETDDGARLDAAEDAVLAAERALQDSEGEDVARERAERDLADARAERAEAEAESGPMLPMDEVVHVRRFPAYVDSVTGAVGARVDGPVLGLSAGELVVQGYLQEHQRELVTAGQPVRILSELSGEETAAEVASVAATPETGKAPEGAAAEAPPAGSYRLVVEPEKALRSGSAGQDVRLTIESASTEGRALVVPLSAVSAGADGRTSVTVLGPDGTRRRVEVRAGTQGDGYVAVVPSTGASALRPGERVIVGLR